MGEKLKRQLQNALLQGGDERAWALQRPLTLPWPRSRHQISTVAGGSREFRVSPGSRQSAEIGGWCDLGGKSSGFPREPGTY